MKAKWISTGKRLPETLCVVMCCNVNVRSAPIVLATRVKQDLFYLIENGDLTRKVTHWMPLPELPNLARKKTRNKLRFK